MNEEMMKSLVALIDESLAEIEELKKSDRFSASEVKLDGPGAGIAGKDSNGSMGKADDEDDEEDDDEDDKDMDKGEGKNREADPNGGHHVAKGDTGMPAGTAKAEDAAKAEGKNREADPNGGHHVAKADDDKKDEKKDKKKDEDKDDKKDDFKAEMKKSVDESTSLLKTYVDQRLTSLDGKLEAIMSLVKDVANSPVAAKGASYKNVAPLKKSDADEGTEALTKSAVVDQLFELKKSGKYVNSTDIASAELANSAELAKIVQKYNLK